MAVLTKKQYQVLYSYFKDNWKYMVLTGAKRAGKTYINNYIFFYEIRRVAELAEKNNDSHPQYILAGYSSNSIYTNIISSIANQFGIELKTDRHGHYHLFGVDIVPAYTNNKKGMDAIRGMTSYGAYINEASLAVHEVFQEIVSRCSVDSARVICDTNPDIPTHWLKTDYIDNHDPKARIKAFTFTIDDNDFLSKDYVETFKAQTPGGVFYDRDIRGLWVTGDGIVYEDFNQNTMVVDEAPDDLNYYCGVDWGFAKGHENVITVMGDDPETGVTYLTDIFSSTGKFIDYWVDIAHKIQDQCGSYINFWCDSARPEYVSYFQQNNIGARNADKSVMDGIEFCAERIKMGKFKVLRKCAKPFLDDVFQYVWDPVKGVPKKEHDNVMDSFRYGLYNQHKKYDNQIIRNVYL